MAYKSDFEKRVAADLNKKGIAFEYEPFSVPFSVEHSYKPDFVLPNGILVECKGYHINIKQSLMQKVFLKKQRPDLEIRFCFQSAKTKVGKKMTLGDWADKYGFKWCEGNIPEEWINEKVECKEQQTFSNTRRTSKTRR